jgi:hypothetical protein
MVYLLGAPHQYNDIVTQHSIIIDDSSIRYMPYNSPIENLTIETLAQFYADHGITIAMANDAFSFALEWLKASTSTCPTQVDEIIDIRDYTLSELVDHDKGPP